MEVRSLTGSYEGIGKETLAEVKKAGKITPEKIAQMENAAKLDGNYTDGEKLLIDNLKSITKENPSLSLNFVENMDVSADNNKLQIKVNYVYANNQDSENIVKSRDLTQKSLQVTKDFSIMSPDTKKATTLALQTALKNPPKTMVELEKFNANLSPDTKSMMDSLGLNNIKSDSELKSFFDNKTIAKLPSFLQGISSLNQKERDVAVRTFSLLSETPPKEDFRAKIKTMMTSLGKEDSIKVGKTLNKLNIYLPSTNPKSPTSEDLSSRSKTMHMGDYDNDISNDYIRDALVVASKEDYTVTVQSSKKHTPEQLKATILTDLKEKEGLSEDVATNIVNKNLKIVNTSRAGYEWAEDNKFFTIGGEVKTMPYLPANESIIDALNYAKTYVKPDSPYFEQEGIHSVGGSEIDPDNLVEREAMQGAVNDRKEMDPAKQLGKALNEKVTTTRTYNEGGNMVVGTLPNGDSYAVLGRDATLVSTFKLEKDYENNKGSVPEFSPENIKGKVEQLDSAGYFTEIMMKETIDKLNSSNQIPNSTDPTERAKEFLAKTKIVENEIFPRDLGVSKNNLIFIPQPEFHIDMQMRPLKPGQILVNDFDENIKLLESAKKKTTKGSPEEIEINKMIANSKKMRTVMSPLMNEIASKLKAQGIEVIKSPGVMESDKRKVNFMNAVPGTSIGSNRQFYMTNYTGLKPLREAFEEYMKKQDIDKIYWMGDTVDAKGISSSEHSLDFQGGMDCRENREEI